MPSNHLILCHPLLLPSVFPSISTFSKESTLRWSKYWSFSFSISLSNEYPGLISFRIDWFDFTVQGTLKSLLQHNSTKASILWCLAFFMVQLSHPYMTTGKTLALTRRTFVGKVMSLLFNILSRFVIAFLPRSKHLLISWLQSPGNYVPAYTHTYMCVYISIYTPVCVYMWFVCLYLYTQVNMDISICIYWKPLVYIYTSNSNPAPVQQCS